MFRLPALPPEGGGTKAGSASVLEGLRFLRTQPVVTMTFAVDLVAMIFGMPRALFPALAVHRFGGGARTVGYLYTALAAGGFIGTAFGGWFSRIRRQGLAVLVAVAVWGAAVVGFGLLDSLIPALLVLVVSGAADGVSAVFRGVILQTATPDAMRGRLQGVFTVVVAGGPRLGDLESGAAASFLSLPGAVVSGGIAVLVGVAVLAAAVPSFRRYKPDLRGEPHGFAAAEEAEAPNSPLNTAPSAPARGVASRIRSPPRAPLPGDTACGRQSAREIVAPPSARQAVLRRGRRQCLRSPGDANSGATRAHGDTACGRQSDAKQWRHLCRGNSVLRRGRRHCLPVARSDASQWRQPARAGPP